MAASMAVAWRLAPRSLVEVYVLFRGACYFHHAQMMYAARTSETSANFCQTTRRNIQDDSHLQAFRYFMLQSLSVGLQTTFSQHFTNRTVAIKPKAKQAFCFRAATMLLFYA